MNVLASAGAQATYLTNLFPHLWPLFGYAGIIFCLVGFFALLWHVIGVPFFV